MLLLSKIRIYKHNFSSSKTNLVSFEGGAHVTGRKGKCETINYTAVLVHHFALIVKQNKESFFKLLHLRRVPSCITEESAFLVFLDHGRARSWPIFIPQITS